MANSGRAKVAFSAPLSTNRGKQRDAFAFGSVEKKCFSHSLRTRARRRSASLWRSEVSREPATEPTLDPSATTSGLTYRVTILKSVTGLSQQEWDRFARAGCASPFLRHDWLRCMEESGCATANTGWVPQHIVLREAETDKLAAIAPAYIKQHSLGEFVFDHDWAEAAYGAGFMYYPKLLVAVPFTPASGRRILTDEGVEGAQRARLLEVFAGALLRLCDAMRISSVHVNFCQPDEVRALSKAGFLERKGVQYHFTNYKKGQNAIAAFEKRMQEDGDRLPSDGFDMPPNESKIPYRDFDDYLSEFKSKRRIKMKRERTIVRDESGVDIEVVQGDDIGDELMEQMYYIYKSTVDKLLYGRQYLTLNFFRKLAKCPDFKERICLVVARAKDDGRVVGGTFNVVGEKDGGAFYGRYWGCTEDIRYLHFEACYYAAIEFCIKAGLSRMEPGAGGGDFKYMRGFEPSITTSMHYLRERSLHRAVERFLDMESFQVEGAVMQMKKESAIRSKAKE